MCPAEGELHVADARELAVSGIAVDLQHAAEAGEMFDRLLGPFDELRTGFSERAPKRCRRSAAMMSCSRASSASAWSLTALSRTISA